ncbi:hypothetical protein B0J17DRAFT_676787 [Rhizoctonia solani]|nr:hypothetical protein B0J17DRAFT_676787 [Rhizoctonia solani]
MKLFGKHGVLIYPKQARDRERFVSSSLIPYSELSKRLLNSSQGHQRTRPLAMRFHDEWLHPDCPVNAWYKQQTQSSTGFASIQHWRTKGTPLFHEYLLILLDNGAICRVERMGEGSHRSAIKRIGCTAHDIIQWFSGLDCQADAISKEPADLVWQIDFPRNFDLLDVLAICFSIQQTPRCRPYTLQRFNCYFLCLTILTVLARRVGEWEGVVDTDVTWLAIINDLIGYLGHMPCESAEEYIGLGICSLLDPDHRNPRGFILDALHSQLSTKFLEGWRISASETL